MNFPLSGWRGENGKKVFVLLVEKTAEGEHETSLRRRHTNSYNVKAKHWNNDPEAKSGEWDLQVENSLVSRHLRPKRTLMKTEFIWM